MSYDEEFAQIRGVPVKKLYFGLIGMLAVTIVLVIQVVGLILVIALLTIPPFIVEKYANSLVQMMVASSLLGAVFTVSGLWFSYRYNLTSGASIIMVSGIVFLVFFLGWTRYAVLTKKEGPEAINRRFHVPSMRL
jgi:zinc transport system permease protein